MKSSVKSKLIKTFHVIFSVTFLLCSAAALLEQKDNSTKNKRYIESSKREFEEAYSAQLNHKTARLYNYAEKKWSDVPDAKVQEYILSGKFGFESGKNISVVDSFGVEGYIRSDDAFSAFQQGYRWRTLDDLKRQTETKREDYNGDVARAESPFIGPFLVIFILVSVLWVIFFGTVRWLHWIANENKDNDQEMYEAVAEEITRNHLSKGLWAKSFAECAGDEKSAKAMYIALRVREIKEEKARQKVG